MFSIPQFKKIKAPATLQEFSNNYCKASGLPIPDQFLNNPDNHVFGIYFQKQLIGGFILGNSSEFRTVELFANELKQGEIYQQLGNKTEYTEICCFYIDRKFRTNTKFNFFVWLAMTYALKRYGRNYFLFGTCSRSLARLYSRTPKSIPLHEDYINGKATFIFKANRSVCIIGMLEIILYKLKRTFKLTKKSRRSITV